MAEKLVIGRGTAVFRTKGGGSFTVHKDAVYVLDEKFVKDHADHFYTEAEYIKHVKTARVPTRREIIERATAAPGETRTPGKAPAKKPAAKKPAAKKTTTKK